MNDNRTIRNIIIVIIIAIAGFAVYKTLNRPDERTAMERIGDAAKEMQDGADKAAKQMEDQTPADKIGDKLNEMVK